MLRLQKVGSTERLRPLIEGLRGKSVIPPEALATAQAIVQDVQQRGDEAVVEYTRRFDGIDLDPASWAIHAEEMEAAAKRLPQRQINAMAAAKQNIEAFHEKQGYGPFRYKDVTGSEVGMKVMPLEQVGIYAPGGRAAYPSSLLMCALPAKVAGVDRLTAVSPLAPDTPQRDATLAAAYLAGVETLYPIGGAQAVAALAFGTETIPKVDKIVGPGNIYVAAAKLLVYGVVGIDMVAGPSEVLIIADETGNPEHIALDLLSQAEHDTAASVFLVTPSEQLIADVNAALERELAGLDRKEIAGKSLADNGVAFLVPDLDRAVEVANTLAPEHLEIITAEPQVLFRKVRFAGTCFLGPRTPEAVGDYLVGPNHVLPTHGSARFFNGLGTYDFQRRINFIELTEEGFNSVAEHTATFADLEGLGAHAESVRRRMLVPKDA